MPPPADLAKVAVRSARSVRCAPVLTGCPLAGRLACRPTDVGAPPLGTGFLRALDDVSSLAAGQRVMRGKRGQACTCQEKAGSGGGCFVSTCGCLSVVDTCRRSLAAVICISCGALWRPKSQRISSISLDCGGISRKGKPCATGGRQDICCTTKTPMTSAPAGGLSAPLQGAPCRLDAGLRGERAFASTGGSSREGVQ